MFLAIDVGNTHTTFGLMKNGAVLHQSRIRTHLKKTEDELTVTLRFLEGLQDVARDDWEGSAICSVAPPVNKPLSTAVQRATGMTPLVLRPDMNLSVRNRYERPLEVGMDRLANAVAGVERYGPGLVTVDFGTATTLDIVSKDAEYLGGVILPGLETTADALHFRTSKLPLITLDALECPEGAVGRTTLHAIMSGLYYGSIDAVEGMHARIEAELGYPLKLVATGGLARVLSGDMKRIHAVDSDLTLRGVYQIWLRCSPQS